MTPEDKSFQCFLYSHYCLSMCNESQNFLYLNEEHTSMSKTCINIQLLATFIVAEINGGDLVIESALEKLSVFK